MAKTERGQKRDDPLERYFEAGRNAPERPDPAFLARLAEQAAGMAADHRNREARPLRGTALGQIREALGGWPALSGLAAAGLAGLWIGIAGPGPIADPLAVLWTGAENAAGSTLFGTDFATVLEEG
ncbi:hypothetical protein SAMN05421759_11813 [Roseivivax lentus]|uniref:Dihydroorotate dehydrogenase n=1 Tax=Roseivivax lentus TaxID=633194 RepID=A0A1N7PNV6_9RHOB|nr:hypothetical protein [Roseivivax lentus]SIT12333.1 hypothetical protein SAMN05421759_11813 [Roseivivax lentus]